MSGTAITELLEQLHSALGESTSLSDGDRKLLRQLSRDIQDLLAGPDGASDPKEGSILVRLKEAVTRFEVTHPDLTGTLAAMSKTLSDMGI